MPEVSSLADPSSVDAAAALVVLVDEDASSLEDELELEDEDRLEVVLLLEGSSDSRESSEPARVEDPDARVEVLVAPEPVDPEPVAAPSEPDPPEPVEPPADPPAALLVRVAVGEDVVVELVGRGVLVGDGAAPPGGGVLGAAPEPRLAPTTVPGAGS